MNGPVIQFYSFYTSTTPIHSRIILKCTQNKRRVVVALVSAISAYDSPLMRVHSQFMTKIQVMSVALLKELK